MQLNRSGDDILALWKTAEFLLGESEDPFPDKTYVQGIMDTLAYLAGWEDNPFERPD